MKRQEVFDTVARHLLTQRKKSYCMRNGRQACLYRGPHGLRCAVGVLIPDELYDEKMEHQDVTFGPVRAALTKIGISPACHDMLADMQYLHDESAPRAWKQGLAKIADVHKVSPQVLEEFPK